MLILSLNKVSLAYGHHRPLLDKVDFQITVGERVCLVGRNGTGKSTFLRVISGFADPDDGEIWRRDTLRISYLEQELPADTHATVYEVVAAGLGELGTLLSEYHHAAHHIGNTDRGGLDRLAALQQRIEALHGWNINRKVETVLTRLALPADKSLADCSGGVRRRAMLAQALVNEPDLLLLDEPTNHMDISAINWLEDFLLSYPGAVIFISHDRTFLKHLATRIIELDRGKLTSYAGDYPHYLRRKQEWLETEAKANAKFDKKLSEQEAWRRQGIQARRTRNEGRVKILQAMREARKQRVAVPGQVHIDVDAGDLAGKLVANLQHVSFRYDDRWIIRDFSTRIVRGDRVGIIGPNGCGKTTLLKLILGEIKPASGQVVLGMRLQIAYFDQQRTQLEPEKTVRENINNGKDYLTIQGRSRHVISYLKDFLFPPERIDSPVKILSGGERNRLMLARLLSQPANLLVLDEPTNDLDVDTLELLEDWLADYHGTLILVSHDRAFLDNVVTSTIAFEGDGKVEEYVGGYEDWLRQRKPRTNQNEAPKGKTQEKQQPSRTENTENKDRAQKPKLSYKEQRELAALPEQIAELEQNIQDLEHQVSQGEFYRQSKESISTTLARLENIRKELREAYARWEHLEEIALGQRSA